jgi:hypothetical protein
MSRVGSCDPGSAGRRPGVPASLGCRPSWGAGLPGVPGFLGCRAPWGAGLPGVPVPVGRRTHRGTGLNDQRSVRRRRNSLLSCPARSTRATGL